MQGGREPKVNLNTNILYIAFKFIGKIQILQLV